MSRRVWVVEVRRPRGRKWYAYDVGQLRNARLKARAYLRLPWVGETRVVLYVPKEERDG